MTWQPKDDEPVAIRGRLHNLIDGVNPHVGIRETPWWDGDTVVGTDEESDLVVLPEAIAPWLSADDQAALLAVVRAVERVQDWDTPANLDALLATYRSLPAHLRERIAAEGGS